MIRTRFARRAIARLPSRSDNSQEPRARRSDGAGEAGQKYPYMDINQSLVD
jgi:hypothetical protein